MQIKEFNSETDRYINTLNINYITAQMEDRLIITMTSKNIFVANNFVEEILNNKEKDSLFLEDTLKENGMTVYINFKNIESVSESENKYISVRLLNGVEIIIEDKWSDFIVRFKKMNLEKIIN